MACAPQACALAGIFLYIFCAALFETEATFQTELSYTLLFFITGVVMLGFFITLKEFVDFKRNVQCEQRLLKGASADRACLARALCHEAPPPNMTGVSSSDQGLGKGLRGWKLVSSNIMGVHKSGDSDGSGGRSRGSGGSNKAASLFKAGGVASKHSFANAVVHHLHDNLPFHTTAAAPPRDHTLFLELDADRSGTISRDELQDAATATLAAGTEAETLVRALERLDQLFDHYDEDNSGELDLEEFNRLLDENKPRKNVARRTT